MVLPWALEIQPHLSFSPLWVFLGTAKMAQHWLSPTGDPYLLWLPFKPNEISAFTLPLHELSYKTVPLYSRIWPWTSLGLGYRAGILPLWLYLRCWDGKETLILYQELTQKPIFPEDLLQGARMGPPFGEQSHTIFLWKGPPQQPFNHCPVTFVDEDHLKILHLLWHLLWHVVLTVFEPLQKLHLTYCFITCSWVTVRIQTDKQIRQQTNAEILM